MGFRPSYAGRPLQGRERTFTLPPSAPSWYPRTNVEAIMPAVLQPNAAIPITAAWRDKAKRSLTEDMTPEGWRGLIAGLLEFFVEEAQEPEHAEDALALDRESIKSKDVDGRLHVADVPLCRESVDDYLGSEIPGYRKLGLEAGKKYALWRPAEELQKALPSINGIPVLRKHVATSAADHKSKDTIGSTGTGARWDPPFIRGELVIWPEQDIEGIESKERYNLSPGYRYEPILEDGNFEGKPYSVKMVNIAFNHLAVVEAGRQAEVAIDSNDELRWAAMERALLAI